MQLSTLICIEMNIAYYQQNIVWEAPIDNRAKVEQAFCSLSEKIDVMVVPETFTTGFSDNMAAMAEPPEGDTLAFARRMARQFDALFVGTWTVRMDDGTVFNRLHWVYPDGSYGFYDKAHTFRMSSEHAQLGRGSRQALLEWRGWRFKPAVCYDLRFPKWLRNGVRGEEMAYDVLLVCANWPASRYEAWTTLLKARAIENLCYVVGVNRVGDDGVGIPYKGNSAVVDFKGHIVSAATPESDEVRVARLDADLLATFRSHWPFYLDFD